MSCGLHDVITLESRGVPAVLFGTEPFRTEAAEQASALAMPQAEPIWVSHPIQPLPAGRVAELADDLLASAIARLTT